MHIYVYGICVHRSDGDPHVRLRDAAEGGRAPSCASAARMEGFGQSGSSRNGYGSARRVWEQINTPLLRCHPDRLTMKSTNDTLFSRMPRGCASDQPRVTVGLSGWSAFGSVLICFRHVMTGMAMCS